MPQSLGLGSLQLLSDIILIATVISVCSLSSRDSEFINLHNPPKRSA